MIWLPCADDCQTKNPWTCRESDRAHELVDYSGDMAKIRCANCGTESEIPSAEWKQICADHIKESSRKKSSLTKYPRIEPHSGVVVNSREDEKRVWKAKGYHEAPHGSDERTFTDTDYQIKERYAKRTPGWRNLRRQA